MSTLWTPGGERPIRPPSSPPPGGAFAPGQTGPDGPGGPSRSGGPGAAAGAGEREPTPEEREEALRHLEEAQRHLLEAPAEDIVVNHCYGLFELAAVYLSARPPALEKARLAIDALGALVEGLAGRLGTHEPEMLDALAQIRVAFVQIQRTPDGDSGTVVTEGEGAPATGQEESSPR